MTDNNFTERPGDNKETAVKKTGAYAEIEKPEDDSKSAESSTGNNDAAVDSHELGPEMGAAKTHNVVLDPDAAAEQTGNQGQSNKFKARMASFLKGLSKTTLQYKGEVSINDVKVEKEPFEERLKQTEKQTDDLNKTIENNANRNAVVRRILAKYEEKIENNPELASRLDSKAEVIAKVGFVPPSQMSHVNKLVEKAKEVQGKGPFDF